MKNLRNLVIWTVVLVGVFFGWYHNRTVFDTFGNIYELNGIEINKVNLMTFTDFSLLRDSPPREMKVVKITNEEFQPFYDYLLSLEVVKVDPRDGISIDNHANYEISVKLDMDNEDAYLNFEIGKYYLVVIGDEVPHSSMYKHNLSEEKYLDVIDKLEECLDLE